MRFYDRQLQPNLHIYMLSQCDKYAYPMHVKAGFPASDNS